VVLAATGHQFKVSFLEGVLLLNLIILQQLVVHIQSLLGVVGQVIQMAPIRFFQISHPVVAEEVEINLVTALVKHLGRMVVLVVEAVEIVAVLLVVLAPLIRVLLGALVLLEAVMRMVVAVAVLVPLAQWELLDIHRAAEEMVELV